MLKKSFFWLFLVLHLKENNQSEPGGVSNTVSRSLHGRLPPRMLSFSQAQYLQRVASGGALKTKSTVPPLPTTTYFTKCMTTSTRSSRLIMFDAVVPYRQVAKRHDVYQPFILLLDESQLPGALCPTATKHWRGVFEKMSHGVGRPGSWRGSLCGVLRGMRFHRASCGSTCGFSGTTEGERCGRFCAVYGEMLQL